MVNQACKEDKYPIPKIEDLLASIKEGKSFSIDQAYQQVLLDEPSKKLVVINTPKEIISQ